MPTTVFGAYIKRKRADLKLTQKEMADRLGCSQSTISSWETGAATPDRDGIADLARRLNVPTVELRDLLWPAPDPACPTGVIQDAPSTGKEGDGATLPAPRPYEAQIAYRIALVEVRERVRALARFIDHALDEPEAPSPQEKDADRSKLGRTNRRQAVRRP